MSSRIPTSKKFSGRRFEDGFTFVEVLAALMLMAIVIPVAIDALRIASVAGEVAERKAEAVGVAERVLNESIVTANGSLPNQSGTIMEDGHEFHWMSRSELWPLDSMQMLTIEVAFSAQNRSYSVRLSTLVNLQQ
jgi:prepilin-type N-terminal cleavage/methylation domain-containing protein